MKFVAGYLSKYKFRSILAPVFKMLEAFFELLVPLVVAAIINKGIGMHDNAYVIKGSLIMFALAAIGLTFSVTAQYFSAKVATATAGAIRSDVFSKIMSMSVATQENIGADALTTRILSDVNQIQSGVNMVLRLLLRSPFIVVGAAIMAFTVDVKSALVFCIVIPILSVIVFLIMRYTLPRYSKIQLRLEKVLSAVGENLEGARVIRAFNRQDSEEAEFNHKTKELAGLQISTGRASSLLNPFTYVVVNMGIVLLIYVAATQVDSAVILRGEVVALVNYMSQILVELVKLANLIVLLMKALPSAHRVEEIMNMPADERPAGQIDIVTDGSIVCEHVSFSYEGAADESLTDISFTLNPGETLGIIGGTGSGKTTLLKLLYRAYDVTSGKLTVGGRPVSDYTDAALEKFYGVVPQKAVLFEGTVRSNLMMKASLCSKDDVTEDELVNALKTAQAYDFVMNKEGGLDAKVLRSGRNFSGGQRQRLTIARGLVGKPSVLIFDDSASALDLATEASLRNALTNLPWKPSVITVSQRASSVKNADKIIVLEDGNCVGYGNHDELIETCEAYKEIYYCQYERKEG